MFGLPVPSPFGSMRLIASNSHPQLNRSSTFAEHYHWLRDFALDHRHIDERAFRAAITIDAAMPKNLRLA